MSVSHPAQARPIRVAYVIDALYSPAGGTEGQLLHLLKGMDRTRFEPTVFCLHAANDSVRHTKLVVLDLRLSSNPATLQKIWKFSRALRDGNFDIVQTQFRDSNIVGVLAAWLAGTPTIISTRRGTPYWDSRGGLRFLKWLNDKVTRFIANSVATRDRFSREEGFDAERVDVIYNGLEPGHFVSMTNADRIQLRQELELPAAAPVIGIVANLRRVKGIEDFLQAAALGAEKFPEAHFVVVGQGAQEQALKGLAATLGLRRRVHFLGARADVPRLLQIFDIGVLTSHSESFSNSVLEYVAAGLPVIVTDVGGVREAVEDGREGFIVPAKSPDAIAEKLIVLLSHRGGPRAWRKNAGVIGAKFDVRTMVTAHERLYERLRASERKNKSLA